MSEQTKSGNPLGQFAPAFLQAQQSMTGASKDGKNPHFKSRYATLESVIDAIKGPLNDAGISFLQLLGTGTDGCVRITTVLMHTSGEHIEHPAELPAKKSSPQDYGSAITYLKRYALCAICGLPTPDDDGETAMGRGRNAPKASGDKGYDNAKKAANILAGAAGECIVAMQAAKTMDEVEAARTRYKESKEYPGKAPKGVVDAYRDAKGRLG